MIYRESTTKHGEYDGHHIQVTLADFSSPPTKLVERGLLTEERDQHQYRSNDTVDVHTHQPPVPIQQ